MLVYRLKNIYSQYLQLQPLYILRELGRVIGVKAPTSKTKEELVDEIIQIGSVGNIPINNDGRGAPPKHMFDISSFVEIVDLEKEAKEKKEAEEAKEKAELLAKEEAEIRAKELASTIKIKDLENSTHEHFYNFEKVDKNLVFNDSAIYKKEIEGIVDIHPQGYGFVRVKSFEYSNEDAYISNINILKYNLRKGDKVKAVVLKVKEEEAPAVQEIREVNEDDAFSYVWRKNYDELVPYYPTTKLQLENEENEKDVDLRLIDLFSPLGLGQRGLIVAPPKTGKTSLLIKIAKAIETNYPNVKLFLLLIDERPEEVTDIKRQIKSEVYFSTFDEKPEHHIKVAEFVLNRAKHIVEGRKNIVILMDSITRLARAYNSSCESSGKTLTGGLDPSAMSGPKKFFGTARNFDKYGSITILSTALTETGSRMDDVIYEEFKGTGNMEIHLSRDLAEKRMFPAIDLFKTGTRKDELLLSENELNCSVKIRKLLSNYNKETALDILSEMIKKSTSNEDLISKIDTWIKLYEK